MSDLMLPPKGTSAASLLQKLNAEHAPNIAAEEETNVTTLQETNEPKNEATLVSDSIESKKRGNERAGAAAPRTRPTQTRPTQTRPTQTRPTQTGGASAAAGPATVSGKPTAGSEREERLSRALEQAAEDEITVVTVRVSGRLNEYMDRYVERMNRLHPKRRYRKQDAVAEAFAAFYADHLMPPAPEEDDL